MARKAPALADIDKLAKALRKAYSKEKRFDRGTLDRHAITDAQINDLIDLARPIYALANEEQPFPAPMPPRGKG